MRYTPSHHALVRPIVAAGAALLLLVTYLPGMSAYLAFDDFAHIAPLYAALEQATPTKLWEAIWSSNSGPTGRPLSMASLALQIGLFRADTLDLKLFNLLIHFFTGIALYRLGLLVLAAARAEPSPSPTSRAIALVSALLWLVHPFNLTSVAYTIQRMNSLSALFTVLALIAYLHLRAPGVTSKERANGIFMVGFLWACGLLSKENAALLPLYLGVLEVSLLHWRGLPIAALARSRALQAAFWLLLIVLSVGVVFYMHHWILGGYAGRPFSLSERLLTESRVVVWYLTQLFPPNVGQMSLYHDDWTLSTGLLTPPSTLLSICVLAGLVAAAVLARRRFPMVTFGILWFIAGHLLESTVLALELVFEHRNYLLSFGPLLAGTWLGAALLRRVGASRPVVAGAALVAVGLLAWGTHQRAERWSDDPTARLAHLARQDRSVRAQIEAAQILAGLAEKSVSANGRTALLEDAEAHFARASALDPEQPDPLFGWVLFRSRQGHGDATELLPELRRRLAQGKLSSTAVNGMHALTICVTKGRCPDLSDKLPRIFDAVSGNKTLGSGSRNRLLRDSARYRAYRRQAPSAAVPELAQAVSLAPRDLDTRIDYAYFAALAGDESTALGQLDRAVRIDWLGRKVHTLRAMRLAILTDSLAPFP